MKTTKIEWADSTASPWYGCTKFSPGCANCYAEGWAKRAGKDIWGKGKPRQKSKSFERDCLKLNAEAGAQQMAGRFYRPTVFPSLCDWLDDCPSGMVDTNGKWVNPVGALDDTLRVMHECQNLDFLLLTKRPEMWRARMIKVSAYSRLLDLAAVWLHHSPPPNVWVGTSCENQAMADKRIPELLRIPAKVRFLSLEPLLGPIDMRSVIHPSYKYQGISCLGRPGCIDLVIVGGESGPGARPMQIKWLESISDQCTAAGVPLFVKQDSGRFPGQQGRIPAHLWARKEFPNER